MGVELEEETAQAAESIRRITATLSVKHKYSYAGRGQTGGLSWRRKQPRLENYQENYCYTVSQMQVQGGGRQVGVELEEERAQAAESIRRITVTLSVKCKYRYAGRGQTGGGGVGGQSPGC